MNRKLPFSTCLNQVILSIFETQWHRKEFHRIKRKESVSQSIQESLPTPVVDSRHLPLQTDPLSSSTTSEPGGLNYEGLHQLLLMLSPSVRFGQWGWSREGPQGRGLMLWLRPCVLNGQPHPLTEDLSSRKAAISTSPSFWGFGNTASFLFRYRYQPLPTPFTGLYILIILYVLVSSLFFLNAPQIMEYCHLLPIPDQPPPEPVRIQCLGEGLLGQVGAQQVLESFVAP